VNPFGVTAPVFSAPRLAEPIYRAPQAAAPLAAAPTALPDPYVLPRRPAALPSEVDFRRGSSGVRWGRWLGACVLLSAALLGSYRQGWLRQGAREIGLENKYVAGERRVTDFVAAKSSPALRSALTRLSLLPPSSAVAALGPSRLSNTAATPVAATRPVAAAAAADARPTSEAQSELKTVSLESLPVLGSEPTATAGASPAHAARPHARAAREATPEPSRAARRAATADTEAAAPAPKRAKAEAAAAPAPKAAAALPPASPNEGFLKAAIRQAIVADAAKGK
jgi:hypothetical protein